MKLIFMDAGSGALNTVPDLMIRAVKESINVPLIVGGGIKTPEMAISKLEAGADVVVIGNTLEKIHHCFPNLYRLFMRLNRQPFNHPGLIFITLN